MAHPTIKTALLSLALAVAGSGSVSAQIIVEPGSGDEAAEQSEPGWLGVAISARDGASGAQVTRVLAGAPASDAGIRAGDVITAVDGHEIDGPSELIEAIRSRAAGSSVSVRLSRDGAPHARDVVLGTRGPRVGRSGTSSPMLGEPAPQVALTGLGGEQIAVPAPSTLTVVEFWSVGCGACHRAIPRIIELRERFGDRLAWVGVTPDDEATVRRFAASTRLPFDIAIDTEMEAMDRYGVAAFPTWLLVDADGTVRAAFVGLGELGGIGPAIEGALPAEPPASGP